MRSRPDPAAGDPNARYHHGNLRDALIAATIAIIEERGVEHVSIREAAKRAGVSPGAPFRHFPTKAALMTAVAEQAMARLSGMVAAAVAAAPDDPMARFSALGHAYLDWALGNPTHFQIISSRTLIDFPASGALREQNDAIRVLMEDLLAEAARRGMLSSPAEVPQLVLSARAFGYGLARMAVDGHFPEWNVTGEAPPVAVHRALDLFIGRLIRGA
ncbi:TetR/AcrR family transcriptional regulator [Arenibaculum pallidiluteum]|uniref:TetR/AcrR family transcriptional regulator n=1 Tax=Arenibaculum pallidiluteum TaxID=2812559 RepID=UPI001A95E773|nr:TetR/AcrR family transcriptional regulator [Arenibaculum pallidiluteum]